MCAFFVFFSLAFVVFSFFAIKDAIVELSVKTTIPSEIAIKENKGSGVGYVIPKDL